MQAKVNINIAVDVIAALSEQTLHNHIFMMDNSIFNSACQGTAYLTTKCQPGQVIHWVIYAIDLQTPVVIKNISFINAENYDCNRKKTNLAYKKNENLDLKAWTGIVPWYMTPYVPYKYRLEIQMGEELNSSMFIDTCSLMRA